MGEKKELTEAQKRDMVMKYEIAEELGLLEKVEQVGWKGLTSKESGRIGGLMGKKKRDTAAKTKSPCNTSKEKL
ncbi:small, acid-soluble spore protein, alpha/beta type [Anaerotignum neopropionicum]|uniref:Small, acid-soluble spore protein, alpha/beta type n=1 Tax=Anaerotignum neopropionicum TaxID=36847 RepID=A0A136WD27_9FIRM|nr:small, acid-soluble spore protein, alpha/beta type [Anaerotignum neopropionicum]KXL52394.1 small, acid-soluble spore protein, alpha/beta type [Anaerotignum neopropionicum]